MLRLAVTELDAFREYEADPDASAEALAERLQYRGPTTQPMLAGRAFHRALELAPDRGEFDWLDADGFLFDFRNFEGTLDLPPLRELKAERVYVIDDEPVVLVGKVDAFIGKRVDDHKFMQSFPAIKLQDGYQWRCYLDIFDADLFRWNVFVNSRNFDARDSYTIHELHTLECWRYPGMHEDVLRALTGLARFVRRHVPARLNPPLRKAA